MTRRAWRFLLAATLALALVGLGLSISRRDDLSELADSSFLATKVLPELLQRIRNFHRVITREGRKVLEVSAREASYFKNDAAIEIVEPKVVFYEEGERAGEVSADRGRLYLENTEVLSVEVEGNVLFEIGRLKLRTSELTYDRSTDLIHAPGEASVEAAEVTLNGTDLTVNMVERSVVIASKVSMSLHPRAGARETPPEGPR